MSNESRTPIYHFTHAKNLPGILGAGCLYCKAGLPSNLEVVDISLQNIQEKRRGKQVRCEPYGTLQDYVPFHFATRSKMMYRIYRGEVEGRSTNISNLIYAVSSVEHVRELSLPFAFSDGHPIMMLSRFYNDLDRLDRVDWEIMRARYWKDTDEDNDRERRRHAEFLVRGTFPWEAVDFLAVRNLDMKRRLDRYFSEQWPGMVRPVRVESDWYFP